MPAKQKFLELIGSLGDPDFDITIALAIYANEELPQYRSLNISQEVAASFFSVVTKFLSSYVSLDKSDDLRFYEYSAEYKPDSHEIEYMQIENSLLQSILQATPPPSDIPLLDTSEDFVNKLRFNMLVLERQNRRIVLFRKYNRNKELSRSKNLLLRFIGDRYEMLTDTTFQFDDRFDAILFDNFIFSFNKSNFQHIFRFYELLQSAAEQSLETIRASVPIANFEEFKESCLGHRQKLEKLRNIANKPYIAQITMPLIKETIQEFNLNVQTTLVNGDEKLLFDKSNRWEILNLLDDAYLGSKLTGNKYEVNSKRQL